MAAESPAITVRALSKSYGVVHALRGIDFDVPRGAIFAYLGPNGAGKTTTINILCGLTARDAGSVAILGRDVAEAPVFVKSRIGVVTENSNLYPELRCRRNLEYLGELYGLPATERRERADRLLAEFGLAEKSDARFGSLSRGMKRRLTIAAALVHRPELLFLDEPTTGLDVPSARGLRKLIRDIAGAGTTVFLTTHNLDEAEDLADHITVLVGGRIAAAGTVAEIRGRVPAVNVLTVVFSAPVEPDDVRAAAPAVRDVEMREGACRLEAADLHEAVTQIADYCRSRNLRITGIRTEEASLEDVFVSLLEREQGRE